MAEVDYLGHVVSGSGVKADPKKITAMLEWPEPNNLKVLWLFLDLTGYYQKFIKGYGLIATPLIALLKKNAFNWSEAASKSFDELKRAVTKPLVHSLLDFNQPFTLECDASGYGVGVVLMQKGRPITFMSKALNRRTLQLSTYEKELLAVVTTVQKWQPYWLG